MAHIRKIIVIGLLLLVTTVAAQPNAPTVVIWSPWANLRSDPSTDAPPVARVWRGEQYQFLREVDGAPVSGNVRWYAISRDGQTAYLHSSTVRVTPASAVSLPTPAPTPTPQPLPTFVPVVIPAGSGSPFGCNNIDDLNCENFSSQTAAQSHWQACGRDEDMLDDDFDQVACEALP